MFGFLTASFVVFLLGYALIDKENKDLGCVMVMAGLVGVLFSITVLFYFPFASTVNECTETWTVCNDNITLDELEKIIDNRYVWVTSGDEIKKLYINGRIEMKFQDVSAPIIEKWEKYKRYNSGLFRGEESKHKITYYLILPEEYKEKLDLWCENKNEDVII